MTNALGVDDVPAKKAGKGEEDQDPVSQLVGEFGRWQLQLTFLLSLFNFPCTWHIFASTFQSPSVKYWCVDEPTNGSFSVHNGSSTDACLVLESNNTTRLCTQWEFDETEFGATITSQWSLVCEREGLKNVAEMTFLVGVAVGGLVSGLVSDRFGRKRTLMVSLTLQIATALCIAFVPWFEMYLALRCFLGFISVGVVFSGFVLCMELVGGKWRTISGVSYLFPVPLSYISIAGIAYLVRGWQNLQLAITLPSLLLLALYWILPESPLWLLALGRKEEVLVILQEAARINGKPLPQNVDKILQQAIPSKEEQNEPKAGILDLFRTPNMRKNSLVLYVIWFSVYLVYYGLVLNLGNIGGDIYINTVISGAVEIPAIGGSIFILLKLGRRWPLSLTILGGGLACLLTLAVPEDLQWLTIGLAMVGKFLVSSSNAVMPVFTAELYPTVMRNLGVGSSNVSAGIALMLVPYLWNLAVMSPAVPMALLGVTGALGGLSVLLLPETAGRSLVGSLADVEELPRRLSTVEKHNSNDQPPA
ncbi:organic cation transporter protein [Anabrus simplex]|uniref:organic cation transporter protein n=1 Tax=Anabrus simplex TaxID=316456 RepID=UPI0035A37414